MAIPSVSFPFLKLLDEIQMEVIQRLDPVSLKLFALTNKNYNQKSRVDVLWKRHLEEAFPGAVRPKGQTCHNFFVIRKRRELRHIKNDEICKLFVLVEEGDITAITKFLMNAKTNITDMLHATKGFGKSLARHINDQSRQELRDCFFGFVQNEYYDSKKLKNIRLPLPGFPVEPPACRVQFSDPLYKFDAKGYKLINWAYIFDQRDFLAQPSITTLHPDKFAEILQPYNNKAIPVFYAWDITIIDGSFDGVQHLNPEGPNLEWGQTVDIAARHGTPAVLEFLLSKIDDANGFMTRKLPILSFSALGGNTENVKFLLDTFPNLFGRNHIKEAVEAAVRHGHFKTLKLLYPYAKQFGLLANDLMNSLNLHEPFGDPISCLVFLLNEGGDADFIKRDFVSNRPVLFEAINCKHHEAVEILLDKGAKTEISDGSRTPLEYAIAKDDEVSVRLLIDHGALITENALNNARSDEICTMLEEAKERGQGLKRPRSDSLDKGTSDTAKK